MRHPVCALAEGAFRRGLTLSGPTTTAAVAWRNRAAAAKWYHLGWWLEHRVREKYGHQDYHFPIPRPEVYKCPKCKEKA